MCKYLEGLYHTHCISSSLAWTVA